MTTDDTAPMPEQQPTDPIVIADDFAEDVREREQDYNLRLEAVSNEQDRAMARIWAPVVAVFFLGLFALLAFISFETTTSHARVKVEHERNDRDKVTVWCFADPNNGGRSTSQFSGSRQNVTGICPDSHELG